MCVLALSDSAASTLHPCSRCVLALSDSRYRSFTLALSCVHKLPSRGVRRLPPQTMLPPLAAAALTGCYMRLVFTYFYHITLSAQSACLSQNYFSSVTLHPCSVRARTERVRVIARLHSLCRAYIYSRGSVVRSV